MVPLWNDGGRRRTLAFAAAALLLVHGVEAQTTVTVVGTDLGLGVVTRTPVEAQAALQLDLLQMEQAIAAGDSNKASNLYQVGLNSLQYDKQGNELPNKRSLSSLSTGADVRKQVTFAVQSYGLANGDLSTVSTHYLYADQFVKSMFADAQGDGAQVAVEASTVLNLWMYTVAQLYKAVDDCALVQADANLQKLGLEDGIFGSAPQAVDQAMAFYMGTPESRKVGLYALAQDAGKLFNTVEANGEATVNARIRQLYEEAREAMSFPNACRTGTNTVEQLWGIAHRWVSQMQVPLMQRLIYNMVEQDTKRIRLYSTAIIPATIVCRDSTHRRLREHLLDKNSYDANKFLATLGDMQELYDCLGFTCADVGALVSAQIPECAGRPPNFPMAAYSPSTNVHQLSKIDLDVKQIKVLVELEEYKPAKHLYQYGKNSEQFRANPETDAYGTLSLQSLAITTDREKADPEYKLFVEYHNDPNYADKWILNSLDGKDKWKNNVEQRAAFITMVLQNHVIYLYALAELADTEADCVDKEPTKSAVAVESWDEVAAVLVGSFEARFRGGLVDLQDGYCFGICPINSALITMCAPPMTMNMPLSMTSCWICFMLVRVNWMRWTVPICVGR